MKIFLTILLLFVGVLYTYGQPDDCFNDTIAPTYTLPYYLADSIYPDSASVPVLWNMEGTAVSDLAFATLEDNCLSVEWPPWYGPTMSSGYLYCTPNCMTYSFTAYDDNFNFNSQQITFYWIEDVVDNIIEYAIEPFKVYPNPCYGNFQANKNYMIRDLLGREREQPLNAGVYIVYSGDETIRLVVK